MRADLAILAWEWLRRDPDYQRAYYWRAAGAGDQAACWSLHRFEPPEIAAPAARPLWSSARHALVLQCIARPAPADADAFTLARFRPLATLASNANSHHLGLSDGLSLIRIDIRGRLRAEEPVLLHYRLRGFASLERPIRVLDRLRSLIGSGRFVAEPRSKARQRRMILTLRASDALRSGATQRQIASLLFDADAGSSGWRTSLPSIRSRVQRLARTARAMAAGGYWTLLL